MQEPIVLICSCKKYINTLHKAIERYRSDKYMVIGLIGDLTKHTSYENNILTLQVEDTYEYLPKKITSALYWITKNFPDTPGVFKTDDDIEMLNKVNFTEILLNNKYKDWWGLKAGDPMASLPDKKNIVKYNDLSLIDTQPAGTFFWGAGYWISSICIKSIVNNISNIKTTGSEDRIIGSFLSTKGFFGQQINIEWRESVREENCQKNGCPYKIHSNIELGFGSYCCISCYKKNSHDSDCEYNINEFYL